MGEYVVKTVYNEELGAYGPIKTPKFKKGEICLTVVVNHATCTFITVIPDEDEPEPEISDRMHREELDVIATELGLDPADYSNKTELVEAVLKAKQD